MNEKYTHERCPCDGKIAFVKNVKWHKNKTPCRDCYLKMVEELKMKDKSLRKQRCKMSEFDICYICGAETRASSGVCGNCSSHKSRHTEMKDRKCLSPEILQSPDYIDCEEDEEE